MRKITSLLLIVSLGYFGLIRCVGSFTLTGKIHKFVQGINNKWISWIVFLVFAIFLVYGLSILADAILFNSIEFHSGKNLLAKYDFNDKGEYQKVIRKKNEKAVLTYKEYGKILEMELYLDGVLKKKLVLIKNKPGIIYARNGDRLEAIKVDAKNIEGQKVVTIREGERVIAVKTLSNFEYVRLLKREKKYFARIETPSHQF